MEIQDKTFFFYKQLHIIPIPFLIIIDSHSTVRGLLQQRKVFFESKVELSIIICRSADGRTKLSEEKLLRSLYLDLSVSVFLCLPSLQLKQYF